MLFNYSNKLKITLSALPLMRCFIGDFMKSNSFFLSHKKMFLGIALCFLAFSSFAKNIKKGSAAPDFSITLSDSKTVKLSDYRGKAVLLHFWGTWCPPCRRELPGMENLNKKIVADGENSNLEILAVCISDTEKNQSSFMKSNKYTFKTGLDVSGDIAFSYGVQAVPTSILISPEGEILAVHAGMMSESQIFAFVKDYVK